MSNKKSLNSKLVNATGKQVDDDSFLGKKVHGRSGTELSAEEGVVYRVSRCNLVGCSNTRLHVRWCNGIITFPCLSELKVRDGSSLEIK